MSNNQKITSSAADREILSQSGINIGCRPQAHLQCVCIPLILFVQRAGPAFPFIRTNSHSILTYLTAISLNLYYDMLESKSTYHTQTDVELCGGIDFSGANSPRF